MYLYRKIHHRIFLSEDLPEKVATRRHNPSTPESRGALLDHPDFLSLSSQRSRGGPSPCSKEKDENCSPR